MAGLLQELEVGSSGYRGPAPVQSSQMRASQFEEIAEKYAGFVYNVALRVVGNPQDAEEVAQDAFISAWKARDRFRGDAQPSTWLYRITVNAALMKLRKDKRRKQMSAPEEEQADVPSQDWTQSPSASAINSELGERLKAAIADLPEDMRVAVVLRDVQGLSNEEAADALGVSVPAVKARLHRGRVALRDRLAGYAAEIAKG